jgi:hypothetical protein
LFSDGDRLATRLAPGYDTPSLPKTRPGLAYRTK